MPKIVNNGAFALNAERRWISLAPPADFPMNRVKGSAEAAFQKALSIAQFISNPTQLWKTHLAVGKLYAEQGETDKSQKSFRSAREVIDGLKSGLQNQDLRVGLENSILVGEVYENS